ncbi:glycoside hydrolase family 19 protein [Streptomyces sp. NPDC127108]|uniref:glycoside hydrolase family 19 protein n=1 Tax=Streptomyces sp. NPDC127108 TaxID=3345361 RepID=UPI003639CECD
MSEANEVVNVPDVVTEAFFDGIIDQADSSTPGKSFYTRSAFITALDSFPGFGTKSSEKDSLWEIAAFFAHVTHETGHLAYIEQWDRPSKHYVDKSNTQYPGCRARSTTAAAR